jgi:hypothetical protein
MLFRLTRSFCCVAAISCALLVAACGGDGPAAPGGVSTGGSTDVKNTTGSPVTYSGQGLIADGFGGYDLGEELCGVENGAEVDGPYLLWVLTANGATSATISGPWGANAPMTQEGNGAFKYVSGFYPLASLIGNVSAAYVGASRNAQLVISHGCRPFTDGAWCSPGFWRNAEPAAWALTGFSPSDLFNTNIYNVWYGATFAANPTLGTVLNNPQTYSGPPNPGTSGYPLNAFNAVGAFLTDHIPGFSFSFTVMQSGSSTACPIDHHGNFK